MSTTVAFIDTSILCNIIPVPGLCQDRDEVVAEFKQRISNGHTFILPITTVGRRATTSGRSVPDGRQRRTCAERFGDILKATINLDAPWTLHEFRWDAPFVSELLRGATTGISFIDHAQQGLGCGDLRILGERDACADGPAYPTLRCGLWTARCRATSDHVPPVRRSGQTLLGRSFCHTRRRPADRIRQAVVLPPYECRVDGRGIAGSTAVQSLSRVRIGTAGP